MALEIPISNGIEPSTIETLIEKLWGPSSHALRHSPEPNLQPYFEYYNATCADVAPHRLVVSVKTHQDVANAVDFIKFNQKESDLIQKKSDLIQDIREKTSCDEPEAEGSINLVFRLLFMISPSPTGGAQSKRLSWSKDISLQDFLAIRFSQTTTPPVPLKFPIGFDAFHLERIAGVKILWTNNMADHLLVNDSHPEAVTVCIFHHVTVLRLMKDSRCASAFPTGLLDETLYTISLIIPEDYNCKDWFATQERDHRSNRGRTLDKNVMGLPPASRYLEDYTFWRDRLIYLYNTYDKSEPKTVGQWWFDRRKKVQWYTFWVAILILCLTVFFGMIQSVTGIWQVVLSQRSLDLARCQAKGKM